jgi:hypothetical protein
VVILGILYCRGTTFKMSGGSRRPLFCGGEFIEIELYLNMKPRPTSVLEYELLYLNKKKMEYRQALSMFELRCRMNLIIDWH